MKLNIVALLSIAATTVALPSADAGKELQHQDGKEFIKFPVPDGITVQQGSDKCGDQAQLSCCNKATYTGDVTTVDKGIGSDLLSHILGSGSGSEGVGLFEQCSKLPLSLGLVGIQDLLNQQCKQNIACCQDSGSEADHDLIGVALPCVALGSIL